MAGAHPVVAPLVASQTAKGLPASGEGLRVLGDTDFHALYAGHARFVWRVLRGMGVPDAGVEDAVQDVFLVAYRRRFEFEGRAQLKTWLFGIAYRVACDYRRKSRRRGVFGPVDDDLRDGKPGPAEMAEQRQLLGVLEKALDRLDDPKRAVFVLSDIEGLTAPEIAEVVSSPINTVYSRLRRARAEIEATLAALRSHR